MTDYLHPYLSAIRRYGAGFEALLWHSHESQARRFAALASLLPLHNRTIVDLGCGTADLLHWLLTNDIRPARYIGVEAIDDFVATSRRRIDQPPADAIPTEILHGDFIKDTKLLERLVDQRRADVLIFSGSLNTMPEASALRVLDRAWRAIGLVAHGVLAFNFLSNRCTDRRDGPTKRFRTAQMLEWAMQRTPLVAFRHDYLGDHDATITMRVASAHDLELP